MVNLFKAIEIWQLIEKYLPSNSAENIFQYTGKILDNMIEDNSYTNYLDVVMIMYDLSEEELLSKSPDEINRLFIQGLFDNEILSLNRFVKEYLNATTQ